MTELELYSKQTQEQGGLWACLERCDKCYLYKTMDMKTNFNIAYTVYNDLENDNEI